MGFQNSPTLLNLMILAFEMIKWELFANDGEDNVSRIQVRLWSIFIILVSQPGQCQQPVQRLQLINLYFAWSWLLGHAIAHGPDHLECYLLHDVIQSVDKSSVSIEPLLHVCGDAYVGSPLLVIMHLKKWWDRVGWSAHIVRLITQENINFVPFQFKFMPAPSSRSQSEAAQHIDFSWLYVYDWILFVFSGLLTLQSVTIKPSHSLHKIHSNAAILDSVKWLESVYYDSKLCRYI